MRRSDGTTLIRTPIYEKNCFSLGWSFWVVYKQCSSFEATNFEQSNFVHLPLGLGLFDKCTNHICSIFFVSVKARVLFVHYPKQLSAQSNVQ